MTLQEKHLGQVRPTNTTPTSVYTVATDITVIIKTIVITNTSGSTAKYRLFQDESGTTYDETTALAWDVEVESEKKEVVNLFICSNNATATFGVRTDTASALTFTLYGAEIGGVTTPSTATALTSFLLTDGTTTDEVTDRETVKLDGTQGVKQTRVADNNIQASLDVNTLTEDTSPDLANDFVPTYDANVGTHKKVKLNKISGGLYENDGTLTGAREVDMGGNALGFTDASGGFAIGTATADTSSILDLTSTTKGFALPRMTTTQMNAIGSPIEGLLIWDNVTNDIKGYDGDNWVYLGGKLEQIYGIYSFDLSGDTDNLGNSGSNTTPTITPTIHNVTNVYRITPDAANRKISGILAPPTNVNRVIHISNVDTTDDIEFMDDNSSVAADGILLRDSANKKIKGNETASFWYDHVISRWKVFNRVG